MLRLSSVHFVTTVAFSFALLPTDLVKKMVIETEAFVPPSYECFRGKETLWYWPIVITIINYVKQKDENRFSSLRIVSSGSCREGTNLGDFIELDLMLVIDLVLYKSSIQTPLGKLPLEIVIYLAVSVRVDRRCAWALRGSCSYYRIPVIILLKDNLQVAK